RWIRQGWNGNYQYFGVTFNYRSLRVFKACVVKPAVKSSPVSGSNGGRPETNTMPPPRVTGETGAFRFASQDDIGSTGMTSRFIVTPLERTDRGCSLAPVGASMFRVQ